MDDDYGNPSPVTSMKPSTGPSRQRPRRENFPPGAAGDASYQNAVAAFDAGREQRDAIAG